MALESWVRLQIHLEGRANENSWQVLEIERKRLTDIRTQPSTPRGAPRNSAAALAWAGGRVGMLALVTLLSEIKALPWAAPGPSSSERGCSSGAGGRGQEEAVIQGPGAVLGAAWSPGHVGAAQGVPSLPSTWRVSLSTEGDLGFKPLIQGDGRIS